MGYKHRQNDARPVGEKLAADHVQSAQRSEPPQGPLSFEANNHCPAINNPVLAMRCRSFVAVGLTLGRIRDERLYRVEFKTFEAYCREKWQYERRHAYQLIAAAQMYRHVSPPWILKPTCSFFLSPSHFAP